MRRLLLFSVLVTIGSGCASSDPVSSRAGSNVEADAVSSLGPTSTTAVLSTTTAMGSVAPGSTSSAQPLPEFRWVVTPVDESNRADVAATWNPACPVALEDLRLVELSHWNYEEVSVTGLLVLHRDRVDAVVNVFERLHSAGFPIERMQLIDEYDGDDNASMADNNTSAFNCREISGSSGVWSQHAYGGAIDINPLVNPFVRGSRVDPPEGEIYADRDQDVPGLIRAGDVVTSAFADVGWGWGGDWSSSKDYQHFSWNGR